jgi:hypothetical protein
MADETPVAPVADATPVIETKVEVPEAKPEAKEAKKPVIDSTKPLSQQTDKLLAQIPEKVEEKKEEEKPEPAVEKPAEDIKQVEEEADEPKEVVELPTWQKYVLDKLPDIQTLGHTEGKPDKVFTVKRLQDLPDDFEFASKRDELVFMAANSSQEMNAREAYAQFQREEQQQQFQELQNKEAVEVQDDIAGLQKEGILPKFMYDSDDPKFNDDPAVKEANEIYDLFQKTNQAYIQANKTYRISYRDAADKFYAAKSRLKPVDPVKPPITKERDEIGAKTGTLQTAAPDKGKLRMPPGSNMNDFLKLYRGGRI